MAILPDTTPKHLWIVGVISLLWNAFGCYDYAMTKIDGVNYMRGMGMSDAAIAHMAALPDWLTVFWALGVWGSLAGSVLLLLRSRHAVTAFVVSLVGLAVSQFYQWFAGPMPADMSTGPMIAMTALIWGALLFFIWYARKQLNAGVLR
jgi:hypothetical protein